MGTPAKSSLYLVSLDLVGQNVIFFFSFYQSVENGFASFHLYVCAAFLKNFSQEIIQENDFQVCLFVFFFSLVRVWYMSRCKTSFSRLYIMSAVVILLRRQHAQNREIVPRLTANLRTFVDNCFWCPVDQSCYKNGKLYFALNFAFRFGCSPYIYPVLPCDCRV